MAWACCTSTADTTEITDLQKKVEGERYRGGARKFSKESAAKSRFALVERRVAGQEGRSRASGLVQGIAPWLTHGVGVCSEGRRLDQGSYPVIID